MVASKPTCKPPFVPLAGWRSSICPVRYHTGSSSTPGAFCGAGRTPAPAWPCSRWGLPGRRHCCHRRWSLTPPFHPHPAFAGQYTSLLHLPSGFPAWPLASTVPCGGRTFLGRSTPPAITRSTWTRLLLYQNGCVGHSVSAAASDKRHHSAGQIVTPNPGQLLLHSCLARAGPLAMCFSQRGPMHPDR